MCLSESHILCKDTGIHHFAILLLSMVCSKCFYSASCHRYKTLETMRVGEADGSHIHAINSLIRQKAIAIANCYLLSSGSQNQRVNFLPLCFFVFIVSCFDSICKESTSLETFNYYVTTSLCSIII